MDSADPSWDLINIHGYLALIALIVIFPLSILVVTLGARWDLWLVAHITLAIIGTIISVMSVIYGVIGSRSIGHLITTHQILGVILIISLVIVGLSGVDISMRWNSTRSHPPRRDVVHWFAGRILVVASFAVCFQGFVEGEWGIWAYVFAAAIWFIWVLTYGILMLILKPPSTSETHPESIEPVQTV